MTNEPQPPPTRIPRLGWLIAFLVGTTLIAWAYFQFHDSLGSRTYAPPLQKFGPAPEFQLTAQDGHTVTKADLKGKVWVADFIFTRCQGPCPIMTSRMAEIHRALGKKNTDVELVSVTVDPEYDTPEVLRKYAEEAGADSKTWKFLTGPKEVVDRTIQKGFFQSLAKDASGIPIHSTRFVLVDRDGQIRGFLNGNDPEIVQKVLMDIGNLLHEPVSRP